MKKYTPHLIVFVLFSTLTIHNAKAFTCTNDQQCASNQVCDLSSGTGACVDQASPSGTGVTAPSSNVTGHIENPFGSTGANTLPDLFQKIINSIIIPIGGVACILAFIYSGFLYVMAQGEDKKIQNAHRALLYTAIGTAVLLGAGVIANVITTTVDQLK
jgi:hypothetical protein